MKINVFISFNKESIYLYSSVLNINKYYYLASL